MIQRLYVHNFKCLENFELVLKDLPSALLIGKNGAGKSSISSALEIFQAIAGGTSRISQFIKKTDFRREDTPAYFEIEVLLQQKLYKYTVVFELPESFKEPRIFEENLWVEGEAIYLRKLANVTLYRNYDGAKEASFSVDWHLVALPLIQGNGENDPVRIIKSWLRRMILLAPIPSLISGGSNEETLVPQRDASNLGAWFSGLMSLYPKSYLAIDKYLKQVMPDFQDIQNEVTGKELKNMTVLFEAKQSSGNTGALRVDFAALSDGEKCFFICALLIAANKAYGPLFCFWDEPDNYLSLSEVGFFVQFLRDAFQDKNQSQILVTSHNPEAIEQFSYENTFFLDRKNHLSPTRIRLLSELDITGNLVNLLIRGDLEI